MPSWDAENFYDSSGAYSFRGQWSVFSSVESEAGNNGGAYPYAALREATEGFCNPATFSLSLQMPVSILLVMALIFFFSAQDGVKSSSTSRSAAEFVLRLLTPGYDDLPVSQRRGCRKTAERIVRKLQDPFVDRFHRLAFFREDLVPHLPDR